MIFYCKHYKKIINQGKAYKYCANKMNCLALKIFFNKFAYKKYIKKLCKQTKKHTRKNQG